MGDSLSSVPQPTPGDELHTSWASTLIAELTSMLTRLGLLEAATVVDLCDSAGQDVADAGAVGTSTYASRCDHKHEGVHSLVAGTNITLSPSSGLGDVTVTASAGGGGLQAGRTTYTGDIVEPTKGNEPKLVWELWNLDDTYHHTLTLSCAWVSQEEAEVQKQLMRESNVYLKMMADSLLRL